MSARLVPLLLTTTLLLWLGTGTVNAATHVNISIGSQHSTHPADVAYVDGQAPAELRLGQLKAKHHSHQSDFSFRGDGIGSDSSSGSFSGSSAKLRAYPDHQHSSDYENSQTTARFTHGRQQSGSSANLKEQHRQNQEFERYIQNYHSGPTVETVFESAAPSSSSQHQKSISSSSKSQRLVAGDSRSTQVHTFERQIASTLLPPTDDRQAHTVVSHQQPKVFSFDGASSSSSSSGTSSSSGGYDQPGFAYDDDDVQAQYPPSVDESQLNYGSSGGGSYYNGGDSTPAPGYLPSYPRPVVTKTIQIAQPALKAKKFEIRHPAVQKEFYDIEERVVIKPAGTIVVELERPVAKIPKGETVLPLGHPHPAVASAYNTNGAAIVQTNDVSSGDNINSQYSPSPVYNPNKGISETQYPLHAAIGSTTIGSAVTTTPSDESSSRDEFVEATLNKQFNADAQYIATTDRNYVDEKQNNDGFYVTTTETNRNYGQQYFSRDETDRRYSPSAVTGHIEVKNNVAPAVSTTFTGSKQYGSSSSSPLYQPSYNDNNNQFKGELLSGEFYSHQQGSKPARLQEQPRIRSGQSAQIIKHENNIHLAPSQQTIYLNSQKQEPTSLNGRLELRSQTRSGPRYHEEAAQVLELKPYIKHHPGAVVVYAPAAVRPSSTSSFSGRYSQQQRSDGEYARYAMPQEHHYHSNAFNNVKYSAPYTSMRYYSDQSPRYAYGSEYRYGEKANLVQDTTSNIDRNSNSNSVSTHSHQAHIHVQVPHHPHEVGKPIVVTSAINPIVHESNTARSSKYRQSATASYNRDRDTDGDADAERFALSSDYRSAQNANGNYNGQTGDRLVVEKSSRLIESASPSSVESNTASLHSGSADINLKSAQGHVGTSGSRVIAAAPAPTDAASASESFHKRRIVVNHPFQTVREVVEHEPITNYHHVQVSEPASPELYHHTSQYYQPETHGALRTGIYHHQSAQTHGNLHYAPVVPLVHGVTVDYHHG